MEKETKGELALARLRIIAGVFASCAFFFVCAQQADDSFKQGVELYNQNRLDDALPLLVSASEKPGASSEAFAYLAETYRRLGEREKALLADGEALRGDSCSSFAHITLSYIYNPMYGDWEGADRAKSWEHILKGIECDPGDGNVWLAAWTEAIHNRNEDIERKSLKMLIQTNFFPPAIFAYNRWMLKDLPQNAILLTNGDMDTYPAVALQEAEGFRADVTVMNYSLLSTRWYQDYIQNRRGVKMPLNDDEFDRLKVHEDSEGRVVTVASQIMERILQAKSHDLFERPVAISITVADSGFARGYEDYFVLRGAYKLWRIEPSNIRYDLDAIKASLEGLNLADFTGPFASDADRSPVRKVTAKKVADNFMHLAILYINRKSEMNQPDEAAEMLHWAQRADSLVIKDPGTAARLKQLEGSLVKGE
jgi:tetratricopeptide (TPR) repeat protein